MKKALIITLFLFFMPVFLMAIDINSPIVKSPHNLASWAPSVRTNVRVRAVSETEICKFCHLAHSASVEPLWGHRFSSATYKLYSSATLKSPRNQPDGGSKQCLSCHDGTVAIGGTLKGNIAVTGSDVDVQGRLITTSVLNLGTDLQSPGANTHLKHPISIAVTDSLIAATQVNTWRLRPSRTVNGKYEIDQYGPSGNDVYYPLRPTIYAHSDGTRNPNRTGMQCTTCHDAHDNTYGYFVREPVNFDNYSCSHSGPTSGGLCYHCHEPQPPVIK